MPTMSLLWRQESLPTRKWSALCKLQHHWGRDCQQRTTIGLSNTPMSKYRTHERAHSLSLQSLKPKITSTRRSRRKRTLAQLLLYSESRSHTAVAFKAWSESGQQNMHVCRSALCRSFGRCSTQLGHFLTHFCCPG